MCRKCNRKSAGEFCSKCSSKIIEKRVRKYIRVNKIIEKNDTVLVMDKLTLHLVEPYKKITKIVYKPRSKKFDYDKVLIPYTMDSATSEYLDMMFCGKKPRVRPITSVLIVATNQELSEYCKTKDLLMPKGLKTSKFLDIMNTRFPGTKHAFFKSIIKNYKKAAS